MNAMLNIPPYVRLNLNAKKRHLNADGFPRSDSAA